MTDPPMFVIAWSYFVTMLVKLLLIIYGPEEGAEGGTAKSILTLGLVTDPWRLYASKFNVKVLPKLVESKVIVLCRRIVTSYCPLFTIIEGVPDKPSSIYNLYPRIGQFPF